MYTNRVTSCSIGKHNWLRGPNPGSWSRSPPCQSIRTASIHHRICTVKLRSDTNQHTTYRQPERSKLKKNQKKAYWCFPLKFAIFFLLNTYRSACIIGIYYNIVYREPERSKIYQKIRKKLIHVSLWTLRYFFLLKRYK